MAAYEPITRWLSDDDPLARLYAESTDRLLAMPVSDSICLNVKHVDAYGITYTLENTSDRVYTWGAFHILQWKNGKWTSIDPFRRMAWAAIAIPFPAHSGIHEFEFDWTKTFWNNETQDWNFVKLSSGRYRFVQDFQYIDYTVSREPGDAVEMYKVLHDFTVYPDKAVLIVSGIAPTLVILSGVLLYVRKPKHIKQNG